MATTEHEAECGVPSNVSPVGLHWSHALEVGLKVKGAGRENEPSSRLQPVEYSLPHIRDPNDLGTYE